MRLSLCMIVKDEEINLPECLEHIKSVVDEIIVVDTGSKDNTPDIAKRFGAKVYYFKWCDDFSAARNESLRHATGDYIIYLDADDRIDEENVKKLARLKENFPEKKDLAYSLKIALPSQDGKSSAYQIRIFPNLPDIRFENPIHEQIIPSLKRNGIKGVRTDITIEHKGYEDPLILRKKAERNLHILKRMLQEDPDSWFAHYFLAQTYEVLGETDLFEYHLKKAMCKELKESDPSWFIHAGIKLGWIYVEKGEKDRARHIIFKLKDEFPENDLVKFFVAEAYLEEKEYANALNYYLTINLENIFLSSVPVPEDEIRFGYYLNMGRCNEGLGYYNMAISSYKNAYKNAYSDEKKKDALIRIIFLSTKLNKLKDASPYIEEYVEIDPSPISYTLLALGYMENRLYEEAEKYLRKAISLDPSYYNSQIKLSQLFIEQGRLIEAEKIVADLLVKDDLSYEERKIALLMAAFLCISKFDIERFISFTDLILRHLGKRADIKSFEELGILYENLQPFFNDSYESFFRGIKSCINFIDKSSSVLNQKASVSAPM